MSTCRMVDSRGSSGSVGSPCFARNRARSGMTIAYSEPPRRTTSEDESDALSREHPRNAGQVRRDSDASPLRRIEERTNGRQRVVAQFENQDASGLEVRGGLADQVGVEFV